MIKKTYNVITLMSETDKLYEKIREKRPDVDKVSFTRDKIVSERHWEPSLPLIKNNFTRVLEELKVFYIPNLMHPGPVFVFPIRDLDGTYPYAQTKPLTASELYSAKAKYTRIGQPPISPQWLGNSPETLLQVLRYNKVVIVEGPFDLLACRLVCPNLPILCPLTKLVTSKHEDYLEMLGVSEMVLIFDNELNKKDGGHMGAGNIAMYEQQKISRLNTSVLLSPPSDPSDALKSKASAIKLRDLLLRAFGKWEYPEDVL